MRLRLLTSLVSPHGAWSEGDEYTTDDTTAQRMIASGAAVPCEVGGVELALGSAGPERAVVVKGRRRRYA